MWLLLRRDALALLFFHSHVLYRVIFKRCCTCWLDAVKVCRLGCAFFFLQCSHVWRTVNNPFVPVAVQIRVLNQYFMLFLRWLRSDQEKSRKKATEILQHLWNQGMTIKSRTRIVVQTVQNTRCFRGNEAANARDWI
jgi:hypothetical protein